MLESFCHKYLKRPPSQSSKEKDLYSLYIVGCVLNAFLACATIVLNAATIQAVRKASSLPKPLKILLLSLAWSDVGVGLLGQPLYIASLVQTELNNTRPSCFFWIFYSAIIPMFVAAPFLNITAMSVDRFMAIHFHLRYRELVTKKRVVVAVIVMWVYCACFPWTYTWLDSFTILLYSTIFGTVCLVGTSVVYFRIYLAVKRHRKRIKRDAEVPPHTIIQNGGLPAAKLARFRKSAVTTFYIYFVFLACYLPQICFGIYIRSMETNEPTAVVKGISLLAMTLVFLNSLLNPIIYCWKMRHVRQALAGNIRKMFAVKSR